MLSFLFLLNAVRVMADFLINGGIIAEIALGMVYGAPLGNILSAEWEGTFTVLGYLGLIGLVFEGEKEASFTVTKSVLIEILAYSQVVLRPICRYYLRIFPYPYCVPSRA